MLVLIWPQIVRLNCVVVYGCYAIILFNQALEPVFYRTLIILASLLVHFIIAEEFCIIELSWQFPFRDILWNVYILKAYNYKP